MRGVRARRSERRSDAHTHTANARLQPAPHPETALETPLPREYQAPLQSTRALPPGQEVPTAESSKEGESKCGASATVLLQAATRERWAGPRHQLLARSVRPKLQPLLVQTAKTETCIHLELITLRD